MVTRVNEDAIRERARVTQYEPPAFGIEEALWIAEDPETGLQGAGRVRAEAVGNLVALVHERGGEPGEYIRLPGDTVERTWASGDGLLDRLPF